MITVTEARVTQDAYQVAIDAFMRQSEVVFETTVTASEVTRLAWLIANSEDADTAMQTMIRYWRQ